jgi:outer membrane protein
MKKLILFLTLFIFNFTISFADTPHFVDFNKVLNTSKAGTAAQEELKSRFVSGNKKFSKQEKDVRQEEKELIAKKKLISKEEYQKKVKDLRKKVANLQKNKQIALENISKSRNKARQDLLKAVNPIIKKYMEDNKIRIVLDKESVLMGDQALEITDQIIIILNKEISKLKVN